MERLWTYVKHKRKDNFCVSPLKNEGRLFSYPVDMAELINKQLQSAFSSREEVAQAEFIQSGRMPPNEKQFPVMEEINITLNGIIKLLKELNPYKSPGPNNLRPRVLKEPADDVAPLLLLIYRKSLDTAEVPEDWRPINVTPVFKKGQKYLRKNYRPISLTSICWKIMEHIIASKIMSYGEDNNTLYPLQHGFRRGRSCETQLLEFVDDISRDGLCQSFWQSKKISNDQELIQSDPTSCPQNQKGNN